MRHLFILDPKDFEQQWKVDTIYDSIGQFFRTQAMPEFSTQTPRYPRETIGIIQKQVEEAKTGDSVRVYAIGSEGIFFDCINGTAENPNADLALMPQERTSNFLRMFGEGNMHFFNDIKLITSAPSIPTDVIRVGNVYALNACFVGLTALTTKRTRETRSKKRTSSFYFFRWLVTAITNILSYFNPNIAGHKYTITIDDNDYSGDYSTICIANGRYYGGTKTAAAKAMPNDGLIDITLIRTATPLTTVISLFTFSRGKTPSIGVAMQAKKITIKSESPFWVQTDGEFVQDTNVTFEVVPEAIRIVAPNELTYTQPLTRTSKKK